MSASHLTSSEKHTAMANWRYGGRSLKSQGIIVDVPNGGEEPTIPVLPDRYYWNKPFSRQASRGARYDHDGNGPKHHARLLPQPELHTIRTLGTVITSKSGKGE